MIIILAEERNVSRVIAVIVLEIVEATLLFKCVMGICQHKCYSQQAKKKKRRVARYVEDCNIILFSCVKRPLMMRTRRSFALKIVPKNSFFDFLNEVAVNENGFEWSVEVLFHNVKGYDGMLFWKNFLTALYGRESSFCGNQSHICDIRSSHVRLVSFLSPSLTSFPNFSLTCLTQVKIKFTKDSCRLRHVLSQLYASRQTTRI